MTSFIRRGAFWLLLPISAVQGLWLRRRALRLPEAGGQRRGVTGSGNPLHLLAIGDSIIAGVGAATIDESLPVQFAEALAAGTGRQVNWLVAGENGADIGSLLARLDTLDDSEQADVILTSIGVNDVTGLSSIRSWTRRLGRLIEELRKRWPRAVVIFAGLPQMAKFPLPPQPLRFSLGLRAARLDGIAAGLISTQAGMIHIPTHIDPGTHGFCEDGFHPAPDTYRLWAAELAQRVAPMAGERLKSD